MLVVERRRLRLTAQRVDSTVPADDFEKSAGSQIKSAGSAWLRRCKKPPFGGFAEIGVSPLGLEPRTG